MIKSIELSNFLSHSSTKLNFDKGVTIFVGHNGSGKSSIIDGITFGLFGKHSRKSNRSLIKRGCNNTSIKIIFSVNDKQYEAIRKIDTKGNLYSYLTEIKNNQRILLAAGERKQFGESMTKQIENIIGAEFTKLKIAAIIQQGELNSLIKSKPKEFKEIINAVIGIDKLDKANNLMHTIKKKFREQIKIKYEYDDTHIDILKKNIESSKNEIKNAEPIKQSLLLKKNECKEKIAILQKQIEEESPKEIKLKEINERVNEMIEYANKLVLITEQNIKEKKRIIKECEGCFEITDSKNELKIMLNKEENVLEKINIQINEYIIKTNRLNEQKALASKLKLKNNICPVCNSKVKKLNLLFQEDHIIIEINILNKKTRTLELNKTQIIKKIDELKIKLQKIINAEIILSTHSIKTKDELNKIKYQNYDQQKIIQHIKKGIDEKNLEIISSTDEHIKILYTRIKSLKNEIKEFNITKYNELKFYIKKKIEESSLIDQQFGGITEKIDNLKKIINKTDKIIYELIIVKQYLIDLDKIQNNIFNRDGDVAISLRTWALGIISKKASEYLELLNTKIHRISISEKIRDMSIICYSKNVELEIDSLSGGEKICISIALRLGIMHLLGISNLNCMILDEPTIHLDEERRRSLVNVFSHLSDITSDFRSIVQFIIITHDSEIFENSNVDRIYKFTSINNNESNVTII